MIGQYLSNTNEKATVSILQNILELNKGLTLTLYFYKNIYQKVIYVYFYENIFQDKSIHMVFTFSNSYNLKVIHDFIFPIFNLKSCSKRLSGMEEVSFN